MDFFITILLVWAFVTFFILFGFIFLAIFKSFQNKDYPFWTWVFHISHMIVSIGIVGLFIYFSEDGTLNSALEEDGAPIMFLIFLAGVFFFIASIRVKQGKKPIPKINFHSHGSSLEAFNWKKWVLAPVIVFIITSFIGYIAFDITPTVTLQFGGMFSLFSVVVNIFTGSH